MLHESNSWGIIISNVASDAQPSATPGTAITPGNNTYPAYVEILPNTSDDTYLLEVYFYGLGASAVARDGICTLGFDFSGGTTYTDMTISDLACGNCCPSLSGLGVGYRFPIKVPAGTAIAAKCSVNNATVGTLYVVVTLWGKPVRPELVRAGSFVRTFGAVTATSKGTDYTAGTASEGTYTASLGTTVDDLWAWESGVCVNDSTFGGGSDYIDVATSDDGGTTKRLVIQNMITFCGSTEFINKGPALSYAEIKTGATIYVRGRNGGGVNSGTSAIVYGVGG